MIRRPPRSTRTDTLLPYTTLFRSQRVVSGVKMRLRVATGIGGHDWNILIVGEIKEMWFRFFFKRIQTADDLDIKPAREQSLKPVCIRSEERRVGKGGVSTCRYRWSSVH